MLLSPSPPSSPDSAFDDDIEALRRACMLTGTTSGDVSDSSATESDGESSGYKDADLLLRLKYRLSLPTASAVVTPLSSRPIPGSDDEDDDFETLRAIQRRFEQYNTNVLCMKSDCPEESGAVVDDVTTGKETYDILSKPGTCMKQSKEIPAPVTAKLYHAEDEICNISAEAFKYSQFPKPSHNFVDALKKNRSCQKFIRRKLTEIEAKIDENKELKKHIKLLMDFQVTCKTKMGNALRQEKDPRIKLISTQKSRTVRTPKTSWKKVPAMCFGPVENSHVSKFKMVMKRFPVSLHKLPWSNIENEKLVEGVKQQYQEILVSNSVKLESNLESPGCSNLVPSLPDTSLEVTPEKLRSFLHLVNWDRLASTYLAGRSGAELESRWLNCEGSMVNHNPWTKIEDKKLLYIVQERGVYNWIDIAISLGTQRTSFQCLARYQRSLNPHILNKDWSDEEDARLRAAVQTFGHDWQVVASKVEGRSGSQCSNRWMKCLHPNRKKVGRWSVDEDKCLKVAVMLFGARNWNEIAQFAPGRTQVQCRERWLNCLDPSLNLEPWTEEEDAKLLAAIAEHGYSWSKVATYVPPRTDNQCRRRWKVLLPHEVSLLQEARKIKRTVLITNFVDRQNERPLIGPSDFSLALHHTSEDGNNKTAEKISMSDYLSKKSRAKPRRFIDKIGKVDGMVSSSEVAPADSSLVPGVNSTIINSGSMNRAMKEISSNNQPKKSRAKFRRSIEENLTTDGINSSSGTILGLLSLVPGANSSTDIRASMKKRRNKTSRDNLPKKLKAMSGRFLEEKLIVDGVNSSSETAHGDLSLVPGPNPTTGASASLKNSRERTSRS